MFIVTMLFKLAIVLVALPVCSGHLCLLSPPQRTPLTDLNKPGSDSCLQLQGPCGNTKPSQHALSLEAGSNFTVVFQKNLNHFNAASPGFWSVSIGSGATGMFRELYQTADTNTASLTLYSANIIVPSSLLAYKSQSMVIQTRYVTKNPNAPPVFYQCADVIITEGK